MPEFIQQQDTRRVFIDTLCELAEKDDKIVLIINDVGFHYIEKFQGKFPSRFYNFGVTEASTAVIAAAMALDGWKPYVYSMIPFVLFRPAEYIRDAIIFHKANVKLLGVQGGSSYKFLGRGHNLAYEDEDVKFCNVLQLQSYTPPLEGVAYVIEKTYRDSSPAYIRL